MALPGPFLAGQRLTAGQLNDATQKTLKTVQVGIGGIIGTTSGTTELNIPELEIGPVDLVAGGLYRFDVRQTLQYTVANNQEYNMIIRRDTPLVGPLVVDWVIYPAVNLSGFTFTVWGEFISTVDDPGVTFYTSFQRLNGSNTMQIYGQLSGTNRSTLSLKRVGYSSEFEVVT
jgi:hypothetical protein